MVQTIIVSGPLSGGQINGAWSSGDFLRRSAQASERAGFDCMWFGDHVLLFGSYKSQYPYSGVASWAKDDEPPIPDPRSPFVDPLMGMTWAAAATTMLKVGTSIMILPQRNPVVLAKELACLDEMSGGRVTLGVGVGWCQEEAEAIGVDWNARGKLTDEHLDVMRTLWENDPAQFEGPTFSFNDAYMYPRPARDGKLPVMIGGDSDIALRRVARRGDGWLCFSVPRGEMKEKVSRLRELTKQEDRDPENLRISKAVFSWTKLDELEEMREAGVTEFLLFKCGELSLDDGELQQQLSEAADNFVKPTSNW